MYSSTPYVVHDHRCLYDAFLGVVFSGAGLLFIGSGLATILLYFSNPIFTKMAEIRITKLQEGRFQS